MSVRFSHAAQAHSDPGPLSLFLRESFYPQVVSQYYLFKRLHTRYFANRETAVFAGEHG